MMTNPPIWRQQLLAKCRLVTSLLKRDWRLEDYPLSLWTQRESPPGTPSRLLTYPWRASIINWYLSGTGATPALAVEDLRKRLETLKLNGEELPRPGTKVPIQFAATDRIDRHTELADDFVRRVLGLERAWISNESSLWDFHCEESNADLEKKIHDIYGVDVSDIESGNLGAILDRIGATTKSATP
jgi:hypothetical protein